LLTEQQIRITYGLVLTSLCTKYLWCTFISYLYC